MPLNNMKLKGVASARNGESKNTVMAKHLKSCCEHLAQTAQTIDGSTRNQNQSRCSSEFYAHLVAGEDRVRFATYINVMDMSWEQFENLFLDKYFPPTARSSKCAEFAVLKQGDMTLERYGKHLVETPELKAQKLEGALKVVICDRVVAVGLKTYNELDANPERERRARPKEED
ncbi:hypothetical protein MKW98_007723 [Papaver atlanticum]|uniref:Retrotransposon gag domain-containing protein n=1 Tax=Papaver atlanticum TaxID=357466 RepID=A0AAD4S5A0_9MAGN|nr:hypothetical protein MKW98_007723 [Papaver atlanticum]